MTTEEQHLFAALFEIIPFGVYVVDIETYQIIYANRRYQKIHGDCVHKTCYKAIYKEDSPCYHCKIKQLIDERGKKNNSLTFEHFDEYDEHWYQYHEKIISWSNRRLVKYTIEVDLGGLKTMQNRLDEAHALLAIKNIGLIEINQHDGLTKVFNRTYLNHVLSEKIYNVERYQNAFSVVLIDIDDFKNINDSYGHLVGDTVLIEITQLITHNIRQTDCFGRWGGEEFMIIVPHIKTLNDTNIFVKKLCQIIAEHHFTVVGHCTCSFGVAHCTPGDTINSIIKNAENALYFAKSHGKNQVVIHQNRLAEAQDLLAVKNRGLIEINQHDSLTNVFNRTHLDHVLAEQLYNVERYQSIFCVVLLDIDNFRSINDSYGHLVGDTILMEIAQLVNDSIRLSDCFGRWSGKEFMIIVPHIKNPDDTNAFIEKLCKIIAEHYFSIVEYCTCSFGVAYCTANDTMESIVKNAEDALGFAKSHGKNQVVVYDRLKHGRDD